jgi:hypothetical protein
MARGKDGSNGKKAGPAKTVKSAGPQSPGSRSPASRRPAKTAPDAPSRDTRAELSPEDVYRLIQETAYYKAKARGFAPGHEVQDWIEAEAEVRLRLESRA